VHPHVTLAPRRLALTLLAALLAGAAGSLLRYWLTGLEHLPAARAPAVTWPALIPWWLLVLNALGAFVAAFVLAGTLRHRDPNDLPRVVVITGLLGGLTSYSSLYLDLAALWHVSALGGVVVSVGALLSGALAALFGVASAHRRLHR
jgi:fluoride exporter